MNGLNSSERQAAVSCSTTQTVQSDVAEQAERLMRRNGHLCQQNVSCDFREGVLVIRGVVPSYYLKQVAQEVVASLAEVVRIDNQLSVTVPDSRQSVGDEWMEMAPDRR